ncbi:MAG: efflux RND transporter periplasmic adaptor subunit [Saprospiraceae bacterium]|nr:MAG: efflux RND transporter periplasmic adaptor subunit [Saprospiraceae bacterium]
MKKLNILLCISIALFFGACKDKEVTPFKKVSPLTSVEVVHPTRQAFTAGVSISGKAMPNQAVTLHAMEGGFVKTMRKDIGDAVQKGEAVAILENPELAQSLKRSEAGLERARAALLKAEANLLKMQAMDRAAAAEANRLNAVFVKTPSLTPAAEVERVQAVAESARANVEIARAEIEAAKKEVSAQAAGRDAVLLRLKMLTVRAPFTGIVTRRYVDEGATVQSGLSNSNPKPIVEIQQTNPIRLTLPLPESDAAAVRQGMAATVSFPELPGKDFPAKVSRTAGAIDPASGTMQVEIDLPNPNGLIKPGMYAKVSMQIESRKDVLSLPVTAQVMDKGEFFLMLVKDGKVERIPLKKGLANKDFFEVLNDGVDEAAQVIVQGKGLVKEGQAVEAVRVQR